MTPRVFTKVLAPVLGLLRTLGVLVLGYLDDLLLRDQSVLSLRQNVAFVVHTLEHLGWLLNYEKSALEPVQSLEYLGVVLDIVQAKVFLPPVKSCPLRDQDQRLRSRRYPSIRLYIRLLGKIVSSFEAVPCTQLHSRPLQKNILSVWNKKIPALDCHMSLSPGVLRSLSWWLEVQNLEKERSFL